MVADRDVLGVLQPGSTAAPSAATRWPARSAARWSSSGDRRVPASGATSVADAGRLERVVGRGVVGVRTRGLWAGVDVDPALGTGRQLCEALAARRVLAKDTHGSTIRLAPPIVITEAQLDHGLDQLELALISLS